MIVVTWKSGTARILTNPKNAESFKKDPLSVIDPNLEKVSHLPPHYWKLVNGKVLEKNKIEKARADKALDKIAIPAAIDLLIENERLRKNHIVNYLFCYLLGSVTIVGASGLLIHLGLLTIR